MTDKQNTELFDKIRGDAIRRRQARLEQQQKTDEFFAKIKNEVNPLEQINKKLQGEKK